MVERMVTNFAALLGADGGWLREFERVAPVGPIASGRGTSGRAA